jgi:hypothetical protein
MAKLWHYYGLSHSMFEIINSLRIQWLVFGRAGGHSAHVVDEARRKILVQILLALSMSFASHTLRSLFTLQIIYSVDLSRRVKNPGLIRNETEIYILPL